MSVPERQPKVIIGIGNVLRRDDGIGPLVLDACRGDEVPGCDIVALDGEATGVIDAWQGRDLAIVVDAICTGDAVGTVHDLTIDQLDRVRASHATSSHFAGLADALALGERLNRLPRVLRVMGIEPGDLRHGCGLSEPVAASMGQLVELVRLASSGETTNEAVGE